jgi:hypothetical protein
MFLTFYIKFSLKIFWNLKLIGIFTNVEFSWKVNLCLWVQLTVHMIQLTNAFMGLP